MQLDLTEEDTRGLVTLLTQTIEDDRYPFSPRIRALRRILAKLSPAAPPPPPKTPRQRAPNRQPRAQSKRGSVIEPPPKT